MNGLFGLGQALLQALDPERAHELAVRSLELGLYPRGDQPDDPRLAQTVWGLSFPNPLGMAAGFDKDARVPRQLLAMGLGFVEVGTLTPAPQAGNPRPRIFRSTHDRALINRLGFNNQGHAAAAPGSRTPPPALSASMSGRGAMRRTASPTMSVGSNALPPLPTISPSTSPRPTRRACAISRRRTRSMLCSSGFKGLALH